MHPREGTRRPCPHPWPANRQQSCSFPPEELQRAGEIVWAQIGGLLPGKSGGLYEKVFPSCISYAFAPGGSPLPLGPRCPLPTSSQRPTEQATMAGTSGHLRASRLPWRAPQPHGGTRERVSWVSEGLAQAPHLAALTIPDGVVSTTDNYLLSLLGAEGSKIEVLANSASTEWPLPCLETPASPRVLPWWTKEALVSHPHLIRALIPSWATHTQDLI